MVITKEHFGKINSSVNVDLFTLCNSQGTNIKITNYGCIVTSIEVKDKNGELKDVVLGFNSLNKYLAPHPYLGAVIGRFCNRIKNAQFELNGEIYCLLKNEKENHIHGGVKGFDKVVWKAQIVENSLELSYLSIDGEEGYPGNLKVKVKYILTEDNELIINYEAETDKDTIVNLTNHSYFNLNGNGNGNILKHKLKIDAKSFTPTDSKCIPTGEIKSVFGTPFDFTKERRIGDRISEDNEQLRFGNGYNQNFVLEKPNKILKNIAALQGDKSGIVMEVLTTEPGMQVYTANILDCKNGKNGDYGPYSAIALETQHYPDSPNKPNFPTTILKKNEVYESTTIYRFKR